MSWGLRNTQQSGGYAFEPSVFRFTASDIDIESPSLHPVYIKPYPLTSSPPQNNLRSRFFLTASPTVIMFAALRPTAPLHGGLLWKTPFRISSMQKRRQRKRLRAVDNVVDVVNTALIRNGHSRTLKEGEGFAIAKDKSVYAAASGEGVEVRTEHGVRGTGHTPNVGGPRTLPTGGLMQTSQGLGGNVHGTGGLVGEGMNEDGTEKTEREMNKITTTIKAIERWKAEMPREEEMLPRDKYSIFDRKAKRYRKGIHKLPKWTRISQRVNPPGF